MLILSTTFWQKIGILSGLFERVSKIFIRQPDTRPQDIYDDELYRVNYKYDIHPLAVRTADSFHRFPFLSELVSDASQS